MILCYSAHRLFFCDAGVEMWKWASDDNICREFAKLRYGEAVFLAVYVAGEVIVRLSTHISYDAVSLLAECIAFWRRCAPYMDWIVVAMLVLSHFEILRAAFAAPRFSLSDIRRIDEKLYVLLLGSVILYAGMVIFVPESMPALFSSVESIVGRISLSSVLFIMFQEEIFYRLLLYYSLNRLFGRTTAFVFCVALFALSHDYNVYYPVAVLPAAIMLSLCTILWGNLWLSVFLHAALNLLVYVGVVHGLPFF